MQNIHSKSLGAKYNIWYNLRWESVISYHSWCKNGCTTKSMNTAMLLSIAITQLDASA